MTRELPVLITGASGGIGLAVTGYLLSAGWSNLTCQYRTRHDGVAGLLERHGLNPDQRLFQADLREEESVAALHAHVREVQGDIYGLVNLAGASTNHLSWKMSKEDFTSILDSNLLTTFLCCREFIPEMRQAGRGRIVNISSVVGFSGVAGASHYCAAKAAVCGFTKSIALELAPKNVVAAAIALGYFQYGLIDSITPADQDKIRARIPAQRFGTDVEVGGMIDFLLGDSGAYSGGQIYHLNGGLF